MAHVTVDLKPVPPVSPRYRLTVELELKQLHRIAAALTYWRESGEHCADHFADMCGACQLRELLLRANITGG